MSVCVCVCLPADYPPPPPPPVEDAALLPSSSASLPPPPTNSYDFQVKKRFFYFKRQIQFTTSSCFIYLDIPPSEFSGASGLDS